MPGITIELNGNRIATIDLAGMQVADVSVRGGLDREQKAVLDAMGGNVDAGGCGSLIWVADRPVPPGEVLRVSLADSRGTADRGRTIEELYPDEPPSTRTDFTISDEMAAAIRARPQRHEGFTVRAATSSGDQAQAASGERHTDFSFGVFWDSYHPGQARIRLRTHCLDDVLARSGGTAHLDATIATGGSASFVLVA